MDKTKWRKIYFFKTMTLIVSHVKNFSKIKEFVSLPFSLGTPILILF